MVILEALAVTTDLYKSFLSLFLTVAQSEVQWSYYLCPAFKLHQTPAAHTGEILKLLKSDVSNYFASHY